MNLSTSDPGFPTSSIRFNSLLECYCGVEKNDEDDYWYGDGSDYVLHGNKTRVGKLGIFKRIQNLFLEKSISLDGETGCKTE